MRVQAVFLAAFISLMAVFLGFSLAFADEGTIIIGVLPERNVFKQSSRYQKLADYLSRKTGVVMKVTVVQDYGSLFDEFLYGHLDAAFFGSFTGALALRRLDVEPVARPVNTVFGSTYHGHIFVRKDSDIKGLDQMKGKVFAFVDRASSCGYLYPIAYLRENGVKSPETFFREHYFAGSHDAVISAVLEKKADIGVAKNTVYEDMKRKNRKLDEELSILGESPAFPTHGLFLRRSLDPAVKSAIRTALIGMHEDPEAKEILGRLDAERFVETHPYSDYKGVFEVIEKAGIDLKTYNYHTHSEH